jgi:translation initiation factor 2B subunit (eIF-2B alpha/beta/delta family)
VCSCFSFSLMNKELNKIINDRTSGSTDILLNLAGLFSRYIDDKKSLAELLKESEKYFVSFGVIEDYINKIKAGLKTDYSSLEAAVKAPLIKKNIFERMFRNAAPYLKDADNIFTLSNSRTILEILRLLKQQNRKLKVLVTESRPKNEARILIKRLLKEGIKTEYVIDAAMPEMISKSDAVLIGIDKILKDGSIVNKIGSLNAAILAGYYKKPFYAIGEKAKRASSFRQITQDISEVWKYSDKKLKVFNKYFEIVPSELITQIITE